MPNSRLVRRAPLAERLKSYLDPSDWLIWISEELNSSDWEDFASAYSLYLGLAANVLFVLAQANSGVSTSPDDDGVFSEVQGPGWIKWLMGILVMILGIGSFGNAWLVWGKRRYYRLFEQSVDIAPQTPSAKRVRVDSSPASASPMSFLRSLKRGDNAQARAHAVQGRDVWEVAVWDPNPLCLELFCLFSPLHVLLYSFNLPVAPLDPRPSVRVTTTIFIGAVLSVQLWWLRCAFSQQIKDNALISRQVLNEYDAKFVHPRLQKQARDVGIQTISRNGKRDSSVGVRGSSHDLASEVVTYTPATVINRAFTTNPNKSFASQYDPDNMGERSTQRTPSLQRTYESTATGDDFSSPIRPSHASNPFRAAPVIPSHSHTINRSNNNDGGYLGINTHAASPLRKSSSMAFERSATPSRGRDSFGGSRREGSPLKRVSLPRERSRERGVDLSERFGVRRKDVGERKSAGGSGSGYEGLDLGRRESGRY